MVPGTAHAEPEPNPAAAAAAVMPGHLANLNNVLAVFLRDARLADQAEIDRLKAELLVVKEKVAAERTSTRRILGRLCDLHTNVADLRDELVNLACEMDTSP